MNEFIKATIDCPTHICGICQYYIKSNEKTSLSLNDDCIKILEYDSSRALGRLSLLVHTVKRHDGLILCLDSRAVDDESCEVTVCKNCYNSLVKLKTCPINSLKNMDQGIDPFRIQGCTLEKLTFAETLILSPNRVLARVFRVSCEPNYQDVNEARDGHNARVMRGNTITFKLPPDLQHVASSIPQSLDCLDEVLLLSFVGQFKNLEEALKIIQDSWQLIIRSKPVSGWAEFIIDCQKVLPSESDPLEFNKTWDNGHDGDSVPQIIQFQVHDNIVSLQTNNIKLNPSRVGPDNSDAATHATQNEEIQEENEHETEPNNYNERNNYNSFKEATTKDSIGDIPFTPTGVMDSNWGTTSVTESSILNGLAATTTELVSDFDKNYFVNSMTHLFPAGRDGRPEGMSRQNWAKILFHRADPRFESDYSFVFIVFHVLLKQKLMNETRFKFDINEFAVFQNLNEQEIIHFSEIISKNFKTPQHLANKLSPNTLHALSQLKRTCSFLPKSAPLMNRYRNMVFTGAWQIFGPPGK